MPSYSLAGLMMLGSEPREAERVLDEAFATGKDPSTDKFVSTYLQTKLELPIAKGVTAELSVNRDAVGLALAELKQEHDDLTGAIDIVEQLEPNTYTAISLAELYADTGALGRSNRATEAMKNGDDGSALLCVFRGQALREQGFHDAAHEALKEALRSRSRAAPIRHLALAERAKNYLAQGKKGMARKELERIVAEDSGYEGVREQLAELEGPRFLAGAALSGPGAAFLILASGFAPCLAAGRRGRLVSLVQEREEARRTAALRRASRAMRIACPIGRCGD